MLKVTLGLLVVLTLMFALAWLAKRMRLVPGGSHGHALKVLAVLPLSNRERLALVQVGEQQLLLGVTAHQINCLHQLETPLDIKSTGGHSGFSQLLQQWKDKNNPSTAASQSQKDSRNEG
ncbi:flagellar biosynthetic protein FliO [Marinospirillum sp.]|uniref:flagellar biosynthetic protein FliO n=1 Tax=Marinospirillum sp. TaxID=2183934 RepID=UPI0028702162|nr:flagellar biosynthetic protein FliO [Marinospirillum sp.]MDR9466749.1 flagellar biosynthetic protein FliO [Marinospirillum sp.]